jgi:GNAT superfamily N-acetyltransferase
LTVSAKNRNIFRLMRDLSLHVVCSNDAEEIATFVNSAYRGESSKRGWTTEADLLDGQRTDSDLLRESMAKPENVFLCFREDFLLVASVFLQKRATCAFLGMFTVSPELQGSGIGKMCLDRIENWVSKNWNLWRIEMSVITSRGELIAWYERRGYKDTGRREPFPYNDPRVGIPKVSNLEMMILGKDLART